METLADGVRFLVGRHCGELYLTIAPEAGLSADDQARALYEAVRSQLSAAGGRIFCERVFGTERGIAAAMAARGGLIGDLDDGVGPTRLVVPAGVTGELAGIQVHAVTADARPRAVEHPPGSGRKCGRSLQLGDRHWLMLNELTGRPVAGAAGFGSARADGLGAAAGEARAMFDLAGEVLRCQGGDMHCVARTWLWLDDICAWYGDFNSVRTDFFRQQGLVAEAGRRVRLPASTGIGVGNSAGGPCAMDLLALPGGSERIRLLESAGEQNSAFAYGSAFSRAAIAAMPAGAALLVSGTAAIDSQGRTEHVGQIELQIEATISHLRALLADAGCGDDQVLTALVYCRTAEVEQIFRERWSGLGWPCISMIAEVCRPDLEFEIELMAGPVVHK